MSRKARRHPWVEGLLQRLRKTQAGQLCLLPDDVAAARERALESDQGQELFQVVQDLLDLMTLLEGRGCEPETLRLLQDGLLVPAMERLAAVAFDDAASRARMEQLQAEIRKQRRALAEPQGTAAGLGRPKAQPGVGLRNRRR